MVLLSMHLSDDAVQYITKRSQSSAIKGLIVIQRCMPGWASTTLYNIRGGLWRSAM
jgi:hypothetical protein